MQNICSVTMQEVWTLEKNYGLMYKPMFGPKIKQKGVAYTRVFMVPFTSEQLKRQNHMSSNQFLTIFRYTDKNIFSVSVWYIQKQVFPSVSMKVVDI